MLYKVCMRYIIIIISMFVLFASCNKKAYPDASNYTSRKVIVKTSPYAERIPKVIVVDDLKARRSVDGRYYYDLGGRRYWRNKRDGKYYLFNKSMFNHPDFAADK